MRDIVLKLLTLNIVVKLVICDTARVHCCAVCKLKLMANKSCILVKGVFCLGMLHEYCTGEQTLVENDGVCMWRCILAVDHPIKRGQVMSHLVNRRRLFLHTRCMQAQCSLSNCPNSLLIAPFCHTANRHCMITFVSPSPQLSTHFIRRYRALVTIRITSPPHSRLAHFLSFSQPPFPPSYLPTPSLDTHCNFP